MTFRPACQQSLHLGKYTSQLRTRLRISTRFFSVLIQSLGTVPTDRAIQTEKKPGLPFSTVFVGRHLQGKSKVHSADSGSEILFLQGNFTGPSFVECVIMHFTSPLMSWQYLDKDYRVSEGLTK